MGDVIYRVIQWERQLCPQSTRHISP